MTILVTGATSGFGEAIAERFASEGWDLVVTGRRKDRLEERAKQWKQTHGVHVLPLAFDVRSSEEVERAVDSLKAHNVAIDVLVNNAGLAVGRDLIHEGNLEDWDRMIDTNVKGLLYMTRAISPMLVQQGSGHIINIGSTAGKETYESGNVYCATKHAVNSLSQAMRIDLLKHGIKVTQIAPGAAETEFSEVRYKGDKEMAERVYDGYQPMRAEDIADVAWYAVNLPPHLCLNDIVMTSLAQANSFYLHRKD